MKYKLPSQTFEPEIVGETKRIRASFPRKNGYVHELRCTWEETTPIGDRFTMGLNLTVFGLMAAKEVSGHEVGGEALMAPARSSEKDLKLEQVGLEATGLATTVLSDPLSSIFN